MSEDLKRQVEELSATMKSQAKAQHRFMEVMMFDKLTGGDGQVQDQDRQQTHLLNGLAAIVASPSVGLIRDIIDDGTSYNTEISLLKDVYQVAKDRGSDELRKATARMLGSLMLKSDSKPADIEFLEDDLLSVFSSTAYPQLLNEDDFFYKLEAAFMFFGPHENGLPPDDKKELLLLLDLPMLTSSATRRVELYLKHNKWGPPVLSELREREFVRPKREYKHEVAAVVVKEADLQNDDTCSAITDRFQSEPDTMCVIDVSSFLDANGKLLADKLERLPSSVRRLSFTNGSRCTEIGNGLLQHRPSLTTADLSCLDQVTSIGKCFFAECRSLTAVDLSSFNNATSIGDGFFVACSSLTNKSKLNVASLNPTSEVRTRIEKLGICQPVNLSILMEGGCCENMTFVSFIGAKNGKYLGVEDDTMRVFATDDERLDKYKFRFYFHRPDVVSVRTQNGKYWCVDNKRLLANRNEPQGWEMFRVRFFDKNKVSFRAHNDRYLRAGGGGEVVADRMICLIDETFTLSLS